VTASRDEALTRLQDNCSRALRRYTTILRNGTKTLLNPGQVPISDEELGRVLSIRKEEAAAYDSLMKARRKLWKALTDRPGAASKDEPTG